MSFRASKIFYIQCWEFNKKSWQNKITNDQKTKEKIDNRNLSKGDQTTGFQKKLKEITVNELNKI